MTPAQYLSALYVAGLSRRLSATEFDQEAARLLQVDERTARRYRRGETLIPGPVQVALERLARWKGAVADQFTERHKAALEELARWCDAYPVEVFPEPDFQRAHEVLTAAQISLDAISASTMRHVLRGVKKIVEEALEP